MSDNQKQDRQQEQAGRQGRIYRAVQEFLRNQKKNLGRQARHGQSLLPFATDTRSKDAGRPPAIQE